MPKEESLEELNGDAWKKLSLKPSNGVKGEPLIAGKKHYWDMCFSIITKIIHLQVFAIMNFYFNKVLVLKSNSFQ